MTLAAGFDAYWHGGGAPFEQVTVEPGGTTIVCCGGGELEKLKQPLRLSGSSNKTSARRIEASLGS
jgi:hypothetical protein